LGINLLLQTHIPPPLAGGYVFVKVKIIRLNSVTGCAAVGGGLVVPGGGQGSLQSAGHQQQQFERALKGTNLVGVRSLQRALPGGILPHGHLHNKGRVLPSGCSCRFHSPAVVKSSRGSCEGCFTGDSSLDRLLLVLLENLRSRVVDCGISLESIHWFSSFKNSSSLENGALFLQYGL